MIITLHASTPAEVIDQVVKEIRRQAEIRLAQYNTCQLQGERKLVLARANELNNLADFFARVIIDPSAPPQGKEPPS